MAATKGAQYNERFRARVKATLLAKRLQDHALGFVEMTATQIRAAEILLRKAVPDLASVEHSGEVVNTTYVVYALPEAESASQWQTDHALQ